MPAITASWTFAGGGSWSVGTNWSTGAEPNASDVVQINSTSVGASYTVTYDVATDTVGALVLSDSGTGSATLALGANSLTVTAAVAGGIDIGGGGVLTMATGGILDESGSGGTIVVSGTGRLSGSGTVDGGIGGGGTIRASGGTLDLTGAVAATATGLTITNTAASVLQFDSTVAAGATVTFGGASGNIALTDDTAFAGTVSGLNVGTSASVPTNFIDILGKVVTITGETGEGTNSGTISLSDGETLTLSNITSTAWTPQTVSDGLTGTDVFLSAVVSSWTAPGSGSWSVGTNWSTNPNAPTTGDTVEINSTTVGASYKVTYDVTTDSIGTLVLSDGGTGTATLALGANTNTLIVTSTAAAGVDIGTGGVLTMLGATLNESGTGGGTLVFGSGRLSGFGTVDGGISGGGTVLASLGTLDLTGAVGAGATGLAIGNNAASVLKLDGTVASGAVVSFGTASTAGDLALSADTNFAGTVSGLNVGASTSVPTNFIDILDSVVTITDSTGEGTNAGTITLSDTEVLNLSGITATNWTPQTASDGAGGTDVFLSSPPCFLGGTLILTPEGEVAVEDLSIGDRVVTLSGAAKPIKWIGRRAYDGRFTAHNRGVLPVRVAAGAIADGVPARDLMVSPEHALYIDERFLPARVLVNGVTISQVDLIDSFEYFHIELDSHDVIFAEGATAETFVEVGNRAVFHNCAEFDALYPEAAPADCAAYYWALLDEGAARLPRIRAALLQRAEELGHVVGDPDLHLVVDGDVVRAHSVIDRVYHFAVPADAQMVAIASRSVVPQDAEAASLDTRRLGVPVERIVLTASEARLEIGPECPALCDGFHEGEGSHRWTNGLGVLPWQFLACLIGEVAVAVEISAPDLHYPLAAASGQPGRPAEAGETRRTA